MNRIDHEAFDRLSQPVIPGLRLHCYRLTGSLDDADDMVQEALIRAWRHRGRLADPSGVRPWLYRIATNACLDLLDRQRTRRTTSLDTDAAWPDPLPDGWLGGDGAPSDPADVVIGRETIGLAFLTAVQLLPPRQRAMLVLRDVLEWSAPNVAEALGTTVSAVYSGVRRARAATRADRTVHGSSSGAAVTETADVARRYLDAWERGDPARLAELLAADARMAMPPDPRWFHGRHSIIRYLETVLRQPPGRRIQLAPTTANGGPAFIVLAPDPASGALRPTGIKVIVVRHRRIVEIRGYMDAALATRFEAFDPARKPR